MFKFVSYRKLIIYSILRAMIRYFSYHIFAKEKTTKIWKLIMTESYDRILHFLTDFCDMEVELVLLQFRIKKKSVWYASLW